MHPEGLDQTDGMISPLTSLALPPAHPLFVHGAVVFLPLAALVSAAYVLMPRHRWVLRWPSALTNVLALAFLMLSRLTGDPLAESIRAAGGSASRLRLIEAHDQMAGLLTASEVPLAALALYSAWAMASASPLPSGWGGRPGRYQRLDRPVVVVTVLAAAAVLVLTVLTGDYGARAVWTA